MPSESTYSKYIWDRLMKVFNNEYGVAGLMGNLYAESGLRPNNLQNSFNNSLGMTDSEYTAAVDSGSYSKEAFIHDEAGYGLAQWTFWSRKQKLYEFWKAGGYSSIGNIDLAIDFLLEELGSSYKGVFETLLLATSIRGASDRVLHDFENPADQSTTVEEKRASYGQDYYDMYAGSTPGETPDLPDEPTTNGTLNSHKMNLLMMILATRR